jgi:hypothetical protein
LFDILLFGFFGPTVFGSHNFLSTLTPFKETNMSTLTINLSLDQLKAMLPTQFGPVLQNVADLLQSQAPAEVQAWLALAQSDADAARTQLLQKMTDAALAQETQAAGQQLDADTAANADNIQQWDAILKEVWQGVLAIAASAIMVAL